MVEKEGGIVKKGHLMKELKWHFLFLKSLSFLLNFSLLQMSLSKKQIKKLKGVKAKELMLWPPVSETVVDDDPPTGKIHFKSLAAIKKTFPVEAFAAGQ
ncbi:hypothetical protein SLE2022_304120 [Rubroshorea leprosula]